MCYSGFKWNQCLECMFFTNGRDSFEAPMILYLHLNSFKDVILLYSRGKIFHNFWTQIWYWFSSIMGRSNILSFKFYLISEIIVGFCDLKHITHLNADVRARFRTHNHWTWDRRLRPLGHSSTVMVYIFYMCGIGCKQSDSVIDYRLWQQSADHRLITNRYILANNKYLHPFRRTN